MELSVVKCNERNTGDISNISIIEIIFNLSAERRDLHHPLNNEYFELSINAKIPAI